MVLGYTLGIETPIFGQYPLFLKTSIISSYLLAYIARLLQPRLVNSQT